MIDRIIEIASQASKLIMKRYQSEDFEVLIKEDKSPLTSADMDSHHYITDKLQSEFGFPVLSEEAPISFEERKSWDCFWLVDPLDGTKDFIARTDDFTVNIALIKGSIPILGVIAIPARDLVYSAEKEMGAFKLQNGISEKVFNARKTTNLICTESRFHTAEATKKFCKKYAITELLCFGSAFKLCKIADGEVDVYPRFVPTMEWDTAAGQCILNEAGGKLMDLNTGKDLLYNKESLLNSFFIASRKNLDFAECCNSEICD